MSTQSKPKLLNYSNLLNYNGIARKWQKKVALFFVLSLVMGLSVAATEHKILAQVSQCISATIPQSCMYLPVAFSGAAQPRYEAILAIPPPLERPAARHGDINLALRGYRSTNELLTLVEINGPTDSDAPQLGGLFFPQRRPDFSAAHQVHEWDWDCGNEGCRAEPINEPEVTRLSFATEPEEPIFIPTRRAQIMAGGYVAMVLYAEAERITLVYTRDDTAARGYVVHLDDVQIDDELLALYETSNQAGRTQLPALRNNQQIGVAAGASIKVAIRDTGQFMDPRSRKDWWRGY